MPCCIFAEHTDFPPFGGHHTGVQMKTDGDIKARKIMREAESERTNERGWGG